MPTAPEHTRRWLQFSLGTMFIAVTVVAGFLAYNVNWIWQRRDARQWIEAHRLLSGTVIRPPDVPWTLKVMGERPESLIIVRELDDDEKAAYLKRVKELGSLFPEAKIIDTSPWEYDNQ